MPGSQLWLFTLFTARVGANPASAVKVMSDNTYGKVNTKRIHSYYWRR